MPFTRARNFKVAIGLEFDAAEKTIPVIGTKGSGFVADEIVRIARRYGVPVVEKPALARALDDYEVDQQIPASLFEAVSVLLCELDRRLQRPV